MSVMPREDSGKALHDTVESILEVIEKIEGRWEKSG